MNATNKKSRNLVESLKEFKASNLFAENKYGVYTVYSYGRHWPLFVNKSGKWYGNISKYSVSTSKQQSQCRPNAEIEFMTVSELKQLI